MQMTCQACGMPFEAKRPDAKTCSATCRSRLHRGLRPATDATAVPATNATAVPVVSLPPIDAASPLTRYPEQWYGRVGKVRRALDTFKAAAQRVTVEDFYAALDADLRDELAALFTGPGWSFVQRLAAFSRDWQRQTRASNPEPDAAEPLAA